MDGEEEAITDKEKVIINKYLCWKYGMTCMSVHNEIISRELINFKQNNYLEPRWLFTY